MKTLLNTIGDRNMLITGAIGSGVSTFLQNFIEMYNRCSGKVLIVCNKGDFEQYKLLPNITVNYWGSQKSSEEEYNLVIYYNVPEYYISTASLLNNKTRYITYYQTLTKRQLQEWDKDSVCIIEFRKSNLITDPTEMPLGFQECRIWRNNESSYKLNAETLLET